MKKINFKLNIFSFLAVAALSLSSCDENDVDQDYVLNLNRPVATLTADDTSIVENDDAATTAVNESVASYTLTLDKAYNSNIKYKIELLPSSTASLDDFTISLPDSPIDQGSDGYLITVPKFTTVFNFSISAIFDIAPEQTEKLDFRLIPAADLNGVVAANSKNFSLSIGNSVSNDLRIIFDWNSAGTYVGVDNVTHDLSDYDFDLEIYDAGFSSILADSYTNAPESVDIDSDFADGTYVIVGSLWTLNGPVAPALPIRFQTKLTVTKPGLFVNEIDLPNLWTSSTVGAQQGNSDAYQVCGSFTKTTVGGVATYQVFDPSNNLVVSGRFANFKSLLGIKSKKARTLK
jgi:hypothetical protein